MLELLAGDVGGCPARRSSSLFLPRGRGRGARARRWSNGSSTRRACRSSRWRAFRPIAAALGRAAAAARPAFGQAVVARPVRGVRHADRRRRLRAAPRRRPPAAGDARPAPRAAPRRAVGPVGVVPDGRLQGPRRGRPARRALPGPRRAARRSATRSSTSATRRTPSPPGASPSRSGRSPTTARSTPSAATASRSAAAPGTAARGAIAAALVEAGPLLSPDGSDSQSLDEVLELLVAPAGTSPRRSSPRCPRRSSLRRAPHPHIATLRRRTAGLLAPWDGPAAIVFSDGRRVGAILDRNGLRPASFAVTRDRLVAVASEAGAVPLDAAETVRRGRLGPGEMLLVDPGRAPILEDAEAKAGSCATCRSTTRRARPTRTVRRDGAVARSGPRIAPRSATSPASTPSGPASTSRRWCSRRTSRSGAWATTRRRPASPGSTGRSPTTSARRSPRSRTRRSTPSASGSSWTCGSISAGGRRCSAARRAAAATLRLARPVVADLDGLLASLVDGGRTRAAARRDLARRRRAARGSTPPSTARAGGGRGRRARARTSSSSPTGLRAERLPVPSILAVGAVHTALTDAGLRGRADIARRRGRRPRRPRPGDGRSRSARRPSCPGSRSSSRPRSRARAAPRSSPRPPRSTTCSPRSRRACARRSPGWASARSPRTSAARCSRRSSSTPRSSPAASRPRRVAGTVDVRRHRRAPAAPRDGRARHPDAAAGSRAALPDPGFARFRADGEAHLFSPQIVGEIQALAARPPATRRRSRRRSRATAPRSPGHRRPRRPRRAPRPPRRGRRRRSRRSSPPATSSAGSSSRR